MLFRTLSLPAKLNIAIGLPIALAFVVSAVAFMGIEKVSSDAEQAIGTGRILQDASELSMVVESTGRLMSEPGSQQEVEARITPSIAAFRDLAGKVSASILQGDPAMAGKLKEDAEGLDQFILATMLARGNITEARQLIPSALGSFAEAAMRFAAHLRESGIEGSITKSDQFLQEAGNVIELVGTYTIVTDKDQFDPARRVISNFGDLIEDAEQFLKAAGRNTRNVSRDVERARSKLFGLVTQLGSASERFYSLQVRAADILSHARTAATLLKTHSQARSSDRLNRISGWTNALAIGALMALCAGLVMAGCVPIFVRRSIVIPLSQLQTVMMELAHGKTASAVRGTERSDAIGEMARSVVVFRDSIMEAEKLKAEKAEIERFAVERRRADMHELAQEFQNAVGSMIDAVSSASTELEAAAGTLSGIAENTQTLSTSVAGTFQQASTNVQLVAATTDELGASINQIARQAHESSRIAGEAVEKAHITDSCILRLSHAAERIGDVVKVISSIAGQTNMLALNATIEAARAGDAGRGFSVVAQEVKGLAASTARATEEISEQISSMQAATLESVHAIKEISSTITRVAEIASVILSAVEEQSAATDEIARNIQQASQGTTRVANSITDVSQGATATDAASAAVLASAQSLSGESTRLKREVEKFLATVRAA